MRAHRWWLGVAGVALASTLAGCGVNASVATQINPNGSGTITWTAKDTANDIQTNSGMTVAQATTFLRKYAPTGSSVSGPVIQNGQEAWTITASFQSIAQLNAILQSAEGSSAHAASMQTGGDPWARTYTIADPSNGSGSQWNWITQGLQKANNSAASNWMSGSSTDTLVVPWTVPITAPSYHTVVQNIGSAPGFGVTWVKPDYTVTMHPVMGPKPTLQGTWAMRFSSVRWQEMSARRQSAVKAWWKATDKTAHFQMHHGSPSWTAHVTLHVGQNGPWGTVSAHTIHLKHTFWRHHMVTQLQFTPTSRWVLPAGWTSVGLTTNRGWNGTTAWNTPTWAAPWMGQVVKHPTGWSGDTWTASTTWQTLRWSHVMEVSAETLAGLVALFGAFILIRRRQRMLVACPGCARKNLPTVKFCTACGTAMAGSNAAALP